MRWDTLLGKPPMLNLSIFKDTEYKLLSIISTPQIIYQRYFRHYVLPLLLSSISKKKEAIPLIL